MARIAVFPGSFDPITKGHENVIRRSLKIFDKVIVAIGENSEKQYCFPRDKRLQWISDCFADCKQVETDHYSGLTVDYCKNFKKKK